MHRWILDLSSEASLLRTCEGDRGYWQGLELRTGTMTPFSCSVQKMEKRKLVVKFSLSRVELHQ